MANLQECNREDRLVRIFACTVAMLFWIPIAFYGIYICYDLFATVIQALVK